MASEQAGSVFRNVESSRSPSAAEDEEELHKRGVFTGQCVTQWKQRRVTTTDESSLHSNWDKFQHRSGLLITHWLVDGDSPSVDELKKLVSD